MNAGPGGYKATRVVIVEDSMVVRRRLERLLAVTAELEVVGFAEDVDGAVALLTAESPDAVVLDLGLRRGSGVEVLLRIQDLTPRPTIVVLTNNPNDEYRRQCLALGADAFLDKSFEFDRVRDVLLATPRLRPPVTATGALPRSATLEKVLGFGPATMFVQRMDGNRPLTVWMAPNVESLTGYGQTEVLGPSWLEERVHPEDRATLASAAEWLLRTGRSSARYRFQHRDGSWRWLSDERQLVREAEHPTEVIGTWLDVTEQERVKAALADRDHRYRVLAEATSDAIVVLEDGIITEINRPFTEIYGYTEDDLIGRSALEFIAPESQGVAASNIARGTEGTTEIVVLTRDGSERLVSATARLHRTAGRTLRLLALHDISARRQLERQFHQAQKMEAVGRLAGSVAHDFNNVLTAIGVCTELVLDALPDDHEARADALCARDAVAQGKTLARQLLDFSRPQAPGASSTDLNAVLEVDEQLLRTVIGKTITYEHRPGRDVPSVALAASQVRQIVMNLAINAKDAMPGGGALITETTAVTFDGDAPMPLSPGRYARLVVRDTGVGMSAAVQARVFEPFFTTKEPGKGTGLGLASTHGLVSGAGGRVSVASVPGGGTTFEILLPAAAA